MAAVKALGGAALLPHEQGGHHPVARPTVQASPTPQVGGPDEPADASMDRPRRLASKLEPALPFRAILSSGPAEEGE